MSDRSLIYSNIHLYRAALNLIYGGKYRQRFRDIIEAFPPEARSVTELCFGDRMIAEHCRQSGLAWAGFDINRGFVQGAQREGYDARCEDLMALDEFPAADICVMAGSLYHFAVQFDEMIEKMVRCAPCVLISEPIRNLSASKGPLGIIARRMANAGKGHEAFRFDEASLLGHLGRLQDRLGFQYNVLRKDRDILVRIDHA